MKTHHITLAFALLLAAAGCNRQMICAPCPACQPTVVAAPAAVPPLVPAPAAAPVVEKHAAATAPEKPEKHHAKVEVETLPSAPLPGGRVRDAEEYFATLEHRFQPGAAKDLHAIFQFDLTGEGACTYHVEVDDGMMKLEKGRAEKADVTIGASADDYVKIVNGELGGVGAVMDRKMKVGGNLTLARRMKKIFPGGHADK